MPRRISRQQVLKIYMLRRLGVGIDDIAIRLKDEFEDPANRSTVARLARAHADLPPAELAEDTPYVWGGDTGAPWAYDRHMMDLIWWYHHSGSQTFYGPLTGRVAKWVWRSRTAMTDDSAIDAPWFFRQSRSFTGVLESIGDAAVMPDSSPLLKDLVEVALECSYREIESLLGGPKLDTSDISLWLAYKPWESLERMELYDRIKSDPRVKARSVTLHHYWSDFTRKPDLFEYSLPHLFGLLRAASESDPDGEFAKHEAASYEPEPSSAGVIWADGLLPSQFLDYTFLGDRTDASQLSESANFLRASPCPNFDAWYLSWLDEQKREYGRLTPTKD